MNAPGLQSERQGSISPASKEVLQMTKINMLFLSALALVLPYSIGNSQTQQHTALPNPDDLQQQSCSDMRYSPKFLEKYPKAPAGCQDVRVYKGERFAKFDAKVYLHDPTFTTVQILNVAGEPLTTFSLKPEPDSHVLRGGEETYFKDLRVGDKITVWISEKRLEAVEMPGASEHAWSVTPPATK
jgi:hypothetical protein